MRWVHNGWCCLALASALVSVCPTGRRLATPTGCPTSSSRICRGNSSLDSTSLLHSALPIQIQLAHTQGGMLCLDAQQTSLAIEGFGAALTDNLTGWLLHCLAASLFTHRTWWWMRVERTRASNTTLSCLVWGMLVGLVPDSGLDASSQYPSLGSFTTPAARLMVETRGVPQGFLSYYHVMPSSSPFTGEMIAWDLDPLHPCFAIGS